MRHPAGEPPNRIHFLRLQQLRLYPQPLSEVPSIRNKMRDASRIVANRADAFVHVIKLAILLTVGQNAAIDVARADGLPQIAVNGGSLLSGL